MSPLPFGKADRLPCLPLLSTEIMWYRSEGEDSSEVLEAED